MTPNGFHGRTVLLLAALALAGGSAACGSSGSDGGGATPPATTPTPSRAATMDVVSGNLQAGTVGAELANPVVVRVLDAAGAPVAGQIVNFRVTAGGGTTFAGVGTTNASGLVQERWTLGTAAGTQRLEARAVDGTTGAAIVFATFDAIARPGAASRIAAVSGSGQAGTVGESLAAPLVVKVADAFGNAVPDVTIGFVVTQGTGVVTAGAPRTDAAGLVSASWRLGPETGTQGCEARSVGLASVAFQAQASGQVVAPPAVSTIAVTLTPAAVVVGQSSQATAVLRDAAGNVLQGPAPVWTSSAPEVATVDLMTGLVTTVAAGTAQISAVAGGKTGSATLTVTAVTPPSGPACTWTVARAESLTTVPAGIVPTGGLAGTQGIVTVGGRTAYGTTSDWMQSGIPAGLVPTDDVVAVDVDVYFDGLTRARATGVLFFGDHIVGPSTPYWLNDYGERQGIWAGIDHRSGSAWSYAWLLPPDPMLPSGWGGGMTSASSLPLPATAPSAGWHHIRVEGSRASCAFDFLFDGVLVNQYRGACDTYGGNVCLHSYVPARDGSVQGAFSNLVVSKGSGSSCLGWRLAGQYDLTSAPAGAITKSGGLNAGGPAQRAATVGGRTAWLQTSDWNVLEVPTGLAAGVDEFAVSVDAWIPSTTAAPTTYLVVFNKDANTMYQTVDGAQVFSAFGASGGATSTFQRTDLAARTDFGSPATHAVSRDAWHTFRVEGRRSTCQFTFLVDGVAVNAATVPACNTTGGYVSLIGGGGGPVVPSGVAWSNLRFYTR